MAARLAAAVGAIDGVEITHPVEANAVFARLPRPAIDALLAELPGEHPFYVWDEAADEVRWMCAWDTTAEDVDAFAAAVAARSRRRRPAAWSERARRARPRRWRRAASGAARIGRPAARRPPDPDRRPGARTPRCRSRCASSGSSAAREIRPVDEARERRRHDARVFPGPRIEVGRVAELELPGPARADPAPASTSPPGAAGGRRSSSTTTAAGT